MTDKRMPFGKHMGKPLNTLPRKYLRWLLDNCNLREPLKTDVKKVLKDWKPSEGVLWNPWPEPDAAPASSMCNAEDILADLAKAKQQDGK